MQTIGALLGTFGFIGLSVGGLLFLPFAALKPRRSLAKWLAIGGSVAFVAGVLLTPEVPEGSVDQPETAAPKQAAAPAAPPAQQAVTAKAGTGKPDDADDVLLVIRQSLMPVIFCSGEVDQLRAAADRAIAGRGTEMDAYSAANTAERDCRKMVAERGEYDKRPFKAAALNGIYKRTLPACQAVSSNGAQAASIAKELLNGEATLKKGQQFRDLHSAMVGKITECKLGLRGLAETAGVPSEKVDFLEL